MKGESIAEFYSDEVNYTRLETESEILVPTEDHGACTINFNRATLHLTSRTLHLKPVPASLSLASTGNC